MGIFLPICYILIFLFLIYKLRFFNVYGISRKSLCILYLLKIVFGVILAFIYSYYYINPWCADTFSFFTDGKIIYKSVYHNPLDYMRMITGIGSDAEHLHTYYNATSYWHKLFNYDLYNDNRILIRFNAGVCLFSFGHYYVHVVFMAFVSFTGLTAIYKTVIPFLKDKKTGLVFSVFLIPSVLLWTSGVLKEGILMCALGFFLYNFYKIIFEKIRIMNLIWLIISVFFLMISKFYIFLAVLPGIVSLAWIVKTVYKKKPVLKFLFVHLIFIAFCIFSAYIFPGYDFIEILSRKQHDFIQMAKDMGNVGSFIQIPELQPAAKSLFVNMPAAFFNTLARPHIFEVKSAIMIFSALENLMIITAIILSLIYMNYKKITCKPFFFFSISFVFILFILCGLTTPVLGSLVRYKTPALPFLFIALVFLTDKEKIRKSKFFIKFLHLCDNNKFLNTILNLNYSQNIEARNNSPA
ncbi:MAG: hypothetical protein HY958_11960 [Bacteroidia bacterium]|nr:hypothetical protein [Bacteroidia bacterium]